MNFTFSSRCGSCTTTPNINVVYGPDLCDSPTPEKYLNAGCISNTVTDYNNYNNPGANCPAGYNQLCTSYNTGSLNVDVLCCPPTNYSQNYFTMNCNSGSCSIVISYADRQLTCNSAESILACLDAPDSTSSGGVQDDIPIPWVITPAEVYTVLRNIVSPCAAEDDFTCLPYSATYSTNKSTETSGTCPNGQINNYNLPTFSCNNVAAFGNACQTLTWQYDTQGAYDGNTNKWFNYNTPGAGLQYSPGLGCPAGQIRMSQCDKTIAIPANLGQGPAVASNPINSIVCCDDNIPKDKCTFMANFNGSSAPEDFCQLVCPTLADQNFIGISTPCDESYFALCTQSGCPIDSACQTNWLGVGTEGSLFPTRLPDVTDVNGYQTRAPTSPPATTAHAATMPAEPPCNSTAPATTAPGTTTGPATTGPAYYS